MGQSRPLFVYFRYFLDTISIIQIEKSIDGVLGNQTRGHRMVETDEIKELWRPPYLYSLSHLVGKNISEMIFLSLGQVSNICPKFDGLRFSALS